MAKQQTKHNSQTLVIGVNDSNFNCPQCSNFQPVLDHPVSGYISQSSLCKSSHYYSISKSMCGIWPQNTKLSNWPNNVVWILLKNL
jgi:transcription elongation factor Elf1